MSYDDEMILDDAEWAVSEHVSKVLEDAIGKRIWHVGYGGAAGATFLAQGPTTPAGRVDAVG